MVRDPAALVVTLPPLTGDPARDRAALARASLGPVRRPHRRAAARGAARRRCARAAFEAGGGPGPDIALWMVARPVAAAGPRRPGAAAARLPAHAASPSGSRAGAPLPPPDLVLPWGGDPGPAARDRRRRELDAGLAACRFRDAAWFPALAAALAAADARAPTPATPGAEPAPAAAREPVR